MSMVRNKYFAFLVSSFFLFLDHMALSEEFFAFIQHFRGVQLAF